MSTNNIFYDRLCESAKQTGKSMNCIERELGYSRNALSNYKNGTEPSAIRLIELAHYFHLSPEYLIGKERGFVSTSPRSVFESLNNEQKLEMLNISQEWWYIEIGKILSIGRKI